MLDPKIYTLLKLEELGSYTRAAEALSLTQPAVSHHVKLLEEEYGVQIFVKGSRELKPTAAGALLLKYAHRAAAISEKARQALKDSVNQIERLSIGITPTASDLLAPQVIAAYLNAHPNMRVEVVRGPIKKIDAMLRFYELDFAIVDGVMPSGRYSSILLGTDYLCLIASPDHPFAKRSSVTLDELTNEKLVLRPKAAGTRKLFEGYLISHGRSIQDYRVIMEIDSVPPSRKSWRAISACRSSATTSATRRKSPASWPSCPSRTAAWCASSASCFRPTFSIRSCCASCRPNTAGGSAEVETPEQPEQSGRTAISSEFPARFRGLGGVPPEPRGATVAEKAAKLRRKELSNSA